MDPKRHVQVGWFSVADLPMPGFPNAFWNCKCPQQRLGIEHQKGRHNIGPNRRFFLWSVFIHELNRFGKVKKKAPSFQPSICMYRWPWSCVMHCIPFRGANNSKIRIVLFFECAITVGHETIQIILKGWWNCPLWSQCLSRAQDFGDGIKRCGMKLFRWGSVREGSTQKKQIGIRKYQFLD